MMVELSQIERTAVRLLAAYMEPSDVVRAAMVLQIEADSGLSHAEFDPANCTAWAAAQFWWDTDPRMGRRLLKARLTELAAVA